MSAVLELNQIAKAHDSGNGRRVQALDGISLSVGAGEFVAVRGPSGSGKTTLLLIAGGLLAPDEGAVSIGGRDLGSMTAESRARFRAGNVGFVFQQFHLIPYLSVLHNVMTPAVAANIGDAPERAEKLIARFGLGSRAHHPTARLSTGERQRTALARALLNRPRLLLADEPTGNLDADNAERVMAGLSDFAKNGGAVLLVTHDNNATDRADRVLLLKDGKQAGAPAG